MPCAEIPQRVTFQQKFTQWRLIVSFLCTKMTAISRTVRLVKVDFELIYSLNAIADVRDVCYALQRLTTSENSSKLIR